MDRPFVKAARLYCAKANKTAEETRRAAALGILLEQAIGYESAITNQRTVDLLNQSGTPIRDVQQLQQTIWAPLRDEGIFVAWSNRGIYLPNSKADYERAILHYEKRISSEMRHVKRAKARWRNGA